MLLRLPLYPRSVEVPAKEANGVQPVLVTGRYMQGLPLPGPCPQLAALRRSANKAARYSLCHG